MLSTLFSGHSKDKEKQMGGRKMTHWGRGSLKRRLDSLHGELRLKLEGRPARRSLKSAGKALRKTEKEEKGFLSSCFVAAHQGEPPR